MANVYFLVISILMLIGKYAPSIFQTPLDPYSTIVTFVFVLGVTCVKEASEDLNRYKSDKYENEKIVKVVTFENGKAIETEVMTKEIKGGDIIKLEGKQAVPADMVLLMTSNWDDGNQCYIETANIDGETNLKLKNAPAAVKELLAQETLRRSCSVVLWNLSRQTKASIPSAGLTLARQLSTRSHLDLRTFCCGALYLATQIGATV